MVHSQTISTNFNAVERATSLLRGQTMMENKKYQEVTTLLRGQTMLLSNSEVEVD